MPNDSNTARSCVNLRWWRLEIEQLPAIDPFDRRSSTRQHRDFPAPFALDTHVECRFEMTLFFQLLIGHALADFVLQSDTMARAKDRHGDLAKTMSERFPAWYYWLAAHALVHGGAVYLFTGSAVLGLIEVVLHSVIDFAKCERWIGFHQDQALHVVCKIGYCFFV